MSTHLLLHHLTEDILNTIAQLAGPVYLLELLKIGNHLLTAKLCSRHGITECCNYDRYGPIFGAHQRHIHQLKGLKKLSLFNSQASPVFTRTLVRNLPSSLTDIELTGPGCLEVWFSLVGDKFVPTGFSQFPDLQRLSLTYQIKDRAIDRGESSNDIFDFPEKRALWLPEHSPIFPPTLTSLKLDWHEWTLYISPSEFPPLLEHLDIRCKILSWSSIFKLRYLRTLNLNLVPEFEIDNDLDEGAKNETVKSLGIAVEGFYFWHDDQEPLEILLNDILPAFTVLESLFGDVVNFGEQVLAQCENLTTLHCSFTEDAVYPSTITHLAEPTGYECDSVNTFDNEWYARLPPFLLVLHAENVFFEDAQLALLPRTLTSLAFINRCVSTATRNSLPPNLTRLHIHYSYSYKHEAPSIWNGLEILRPITQLRNLLLNRKVFVIAKNPHLAIPGFPWTTLGHSIINQDYESLEEILNETELNMMFGTEDRRFWHRFWLMFGSTEAFWYKSQALLMYEHPMYFPEAVLEWLRMRSWGLYPTQFGGVDYPRLIGHAFLCNCPEYEDWALSNLDDHDWEEIAPSLLPALAKYDYVPTLEYLKEKGPSIEQNIFGKRITYNPALTAAFSNGRVDAAKWLIENGHDRGLDLTQFPPTRDPLGGEGRTNELVWLLEEHFQRVDRLSDEDGPLTTNAPSRLVKFLPSACSESFIPYMEWLIKLGCKFPNNHNFFSDVSSLLNYSEWEKNSHWLLDNIDSLHIPNLGDIIERAKSLEMPRLAKRLQILKDQQVSARHPAGNSSRIAKRHTGRRRIGKRKRI